MSVSCVIIVAIGPFTLWILSLPKQYTRLLAEHDRPICSRNIRHTMPEIAFELVYIVGSLASATGVLAVYRIDAHSTGADTQYKRIL